MEGKFVDSYFYQLILNHFYQQSALTHLRASQQPIYFQKSGENKGNPVGIPASIKNQKVLFTLTKIMLGEEDVDVHTVQTQRVENRARNITANDEKMYKNCTYRNSVYALLASMYSQTVDDTSELSIPDIKRRARQFTDLPIDGDYRTGVHGGLRFVGPCKLLSSFMFAVWKAIKQLEDKGLVIARKQFMAAHFYKLSQAGRELCYALFNDKFHPRIDPSYVEVKPGCQIDRQGSIVGRGAAAGAGAGAGAGGGRNGAGGGMVAHNNNNNHNIMG